MGVSGALHLGDAQQTFANVVGSSAGPTDVMASRHCVKWLMSQESQLCPIFLSFYFINTATRVCLCLITVSLLPSAQKLTAEEGKENKTQKDKEGMRWSPTEALVALLSPDLNLSGRCSDSKPLVIFISAFFLL